MESKELRVSGREVTFITLQVCHNVRPCGSMSRFGRFRVTSLSQLLGEKGFGSSVLEKIQVE